MRLESLLALASAALERQGARLVDYSADGVTVEGGLGPTKRQRQVPTGDLLSWVEDHPDHARVGIASFFRAVGAVALTPRLNRREADIGFAEAAARMMPLLEGPLFPLGARLALDSHAEPFGSLTFGGLFRAHYVERDRGREILTRPMVERWGVTDERIEKAAESLIFHRTWEAETLAAEVDTLPGLERLRVGDGYDAARSLILEAKFFDRTRRGLLFAVPATDTLLLLDRPDDPAALAAFRERVASIYRESPWPLSSGLFAVEGRGAVVLQP